MKLHVDRGGRGERLLVLLHGLGATAAVWRPLIEVVEQRWDGAWVAPDLRGHGGSPAAAPYAIGTMAADVADLVAEAAAREVVVLGHSLGGAVALALASGWFGFVPERVYGLGIKVEWTDDELARLADLAAKPPKSFATEVEALDRYAKVAGLAGAPVALLERGVAAAGDDWRLAMDPAANAVGAPPVRALTAAARCPFQLGRGEHDALVTLAALRTFDPSARDFDGVGHNAMVEAPKAIWDWLAQPTP